MTFPQRAIGAARLEVPVFEEIEADRTATSQALIVVVLSSLAAGIGLTAGVYNAPVLHRVVLALLLWVFWAISTYIVGVYLMPEPQTQTSVGELLRTIGFAASPGVLRILGIVPVIGGTIYVHLNCVDARGHGHRHPAGARLQKHGPRGRGVRHHRHDRGSSWLRCSARCSSCSRKRLYSDVYSLNDRHRRRTQTNTEARQNLSAA